MEKESNKMDVKQQGNIVDLAMQMFASGIERNVAEIALKNMQYDTAVINDVIQKVWGKDDHFRKYYNDRIEKFGSFNEKLRVTLQKDSNIFAHNALEMLGFLEGLYPMSKIENNGTLVYEAANMFAMKMSEFASTIEVVSDYIKEVRNLVDSDTYAVEAMRLMAGCKRYSNGILTEAVENVCMELEDNIGKQDSKRTPIEKILENYTQIPIVKKYFDRITPQKVECNRKEMKQYALPVMFEDNGDVLFFLKDKLYLCEVASNLIHEVSQRHLSKSDNKAIRFASVVDSISMFKNEGCSLSYGNLIEINTNGNFTINQSEYSDLSGYVLSEALRRVSLTAPTPFDVRKMFDIIENRMFIRDLSSAVKFEAFANDANSNVAILLNEKFNRNRYCVFYINECKSMLKDYKDFNEAVSDMSKWTSLDMKTILREKLIEYNGNSATNEVKKLIVDHNLEILQNLMKVTEGLDPKDKKQRAQLDEVRRMISNYTEKLKDSKENL